MDLADRVVVVVLGDVVGAGRDAVAAADTGIRVMRDNAGLRVLVHRRDRADRDTARVDAMHAVAFAERKFVDALSPVRRGRLVRLHDVVGVRRQLLRRIPDTVFGDRLGAVDLPAADHTGPTADAARGVEQQADRVVRCFQVLPRLGHRRRATAGGDDGAAGGEADKISAFHTLLPPQP